MARAVDIKNFRAFSDVGVSDCRRINIVVGENGSGKTTFLEALFLTAGVSPEIALRVKMWRGFEAIGARVPQEEIAEALWDDLFKDPGKQAWIRLSGLDRHNRTLRISHESGGEVSVQVNKKTPTTRVDGGDIVRFEWKGPYKHHRIEEPTLEDGKLRWKSIGQVPIKTCFFAANQTYSTSELVGRFSTLSKAARTEEIISAFKEHFSSIEDLSIEMNAGTPMLFAKVRGVSGKMPINLISGGMTKLASILFAIPAFAGGIMIIDEIENGFYFKRLPLIWSSIVHFANLFDVQIFASTHSQECLAAAAAVAEVKDSDFSLIRAVKKGPDSILRQFSGSDFVAAIDEDVEVR